MRNSRTCARYALERIPDASAGDAPARCAGEDPREDQGRNHRFSRRTEGRQIGRCSWRACSTRATARSLTPPCRPWRPSAVRKPPRRSPASSRSRPASPRSGRRTLACRRPPDCSKQAGRKPRSTIDHRLKADPAEHIRGGCLQGLVAARPGQAADYLAAALSGDSDVLRGLAAQIIRDATGAQADACTGLFPRLPPAGQAALLDGLREARSSPAARSAALQGLESQDAAVRLAAIGALGTSGTAADALALAQLAAGAERPEIGRAAVAALAGLRDPAPRTP